MTTTHIRTLILAVLALVGLLFPGALPEGARETVADHAVELIGAVLGLWAVFAGHRARSQSQGREP